MTRIGYTMMCEQAGPKQLVRDVALAEQAGFDFAVISDHYFPWLGSQGHSPYAWSVLGAAAQGTERIPLMTYVTCPIRRYHPAVVAQKAATMQLLSDGRFTLGLGAGENLNEHIVGGHWPIAGIRHELLDEVDALIAVEPRAELGRMFDEAGGTGKPRVGQIALSYDPDEQIAVKRALDQFRWFTGNWTVNAELPLPASFDGASKTVRAEDVAEKMPCGPDVARHVAGVRQFEQAGFTDIALIQVGAETQERFISWAATELLPALRSD
jgi:Luciferase-like monooxygenase